jgi:hypothetical protein
MRPPAVGAPASVPMEASFDLVRLAKPDCKPSYAQLAAAVDQLAALDPSRKSQLPAFVHPVQLKQQAPTQPGRLPSKQEPTILYLGEVRVCNHIHRTYNADPCMADRHLHPSPCRSCVPAWSSATAAQPP